MILILVLHTMCSTSCLEHLSLAKQAVFGKEAGWATDFVWLNERDNIVTESPGYPFLQAPSPDAGLHTVLHSHRTTRLR